MRTLFSRIIAIGILCAGCSPAAHLRCRQWQLHGQMHSTMESCVKCVESLGPVNQDAVAGCALGMDAAQFMEATTPPEVPANQQTY